MMIPSIQVQIANITMNNFLTLIMFIKDYCLCDYETECYDEIVIKNIKKKHITWVIGNEKLNS
jgi:hypothetical protein